jgi:hypothetical protein
MSVELLRQSFPVGPAAAGRVAAAAPRAGGPTAHPPGRGSRGHAALVSGVRTLLVALLIPLAGGAAAAADWGGVTPGESTAEAVRAKYGQPSSETKPLVDGYETREWIYEGDRAPAGMKRMVVDFGVLTPKGFQLDVVRTFRLEPHPGVFRRGHIILSWGKPEKAGETSDHMPLMSYKSGLLVYFDKDLLNAVLMVFTRPLPATGSGGAPAPASAAPAPPAKPPEPSRPKR